MHRIGVLTSGGDAPGMNAAVRAVVRKGIFLGREILGVRRGFAGLIEGDVEAMSLGSVADVIQRGGTILLTARSEEFRAPEGRAQAFASARRVGMDGLVVIGGDGSFRGAFALHQETGLPVVCIPATIDNDIPGTDYSIGFDTAVNTVVDAINKIRATATSHERTFVVEVMGRNSGFIALTAGLAGGAESILIPEIPFDLEDVCRRLLRGVRRGKHHSIIVVAEGAASAAAVAAEIKSRTGFDTKITILGHIQRGGAPTAFDRVLASVMGAWAVELLTGGERCGATAVKCGQLTRYDLPEVFEMKKEIDEGLYRLAEVLAI
ncbi:MAG: 6-phosphofructokinase [Bacillota bacterium]